MAGRKAAAAGNPAARSVPPAQTQEPDYASLLASIDTALDNAIGAATAEKALAALATATSRLNGLASGQEVAVTEVQPSAQRPKSSAPAQSYLLYLQTPIGFGQRPGKRNAKRETAIEGKIEKYWAAVQNVVEKFGPTEYQISLGFPQIISVSFTWAKRT